MTSTSANLAACAAATQPLIRTVFFFCPATSVAMAHSVPQVGQASSLSLLTSLGAEKIKTRQAEARPAKYSSPGDPTDGLALVLAFRADPAKLQRPCPFERRRYR